MVQFIREVLQEVKGEALESSRRNGTGLGNGHYEGRGGSRLASQRNLGRHDLSREWNCEQGRKSNRWEGRGWSWI